MSESSSWCPSQSPDGAFICTLDENHQGKHLAGVDMTRWVAEWDDDRSTDTHVNSDFFESLGL